MYTRERKGFWLKSEVILIRRHLPQMSPGWLKKWALCRGWFEELLWGLDKLIQEKEVQEAIEKILVKSGRKKVTVLGYNRREINSLKNQWKIADWQRLDVDSNRYKYAAANQLDVTLFLWGYVIKKSVKYITFLRPYITHLLRTQIANKTF